jgi:hypothetical protein
MHNSSSPFSIPSFPPCVIVHYKSQRTELAKARLCLEGRGRVAWRLNGQRRNSLQFQGKECENRNVHTLVTCVLGQSRPL